MKDSRKYIWIITIFLLILLSAKSIKAEENEFGTGQAWIKFYGEEWQEAPIRNISLDIYEIFYVKAEVRAKVDCWPAILLEGAGNTKTFEVLEGPSEFGEGLGFGDDLKPPGWNKTFIWKLRPTNNKFVGGYTPLKLFVQFQIIAGKDRNGLTLYDDKDFYLKLVLPRINNLIWEGYEETDSSLDSNEENSSNNVETTPGFEIILIILSVSLLLVYKKKKN